MDATSIKAWLVGMRYYDRSPGDALDALRTGATAKRERSNPHDFNAVALHFGGRILGHVDRDSAKRIAPIMDGGAQCQVVLDRSRKGSANSVPIRIILASTRQAEICRWECAVGQTGIYEITVRPEGRSYFGQSTDVHARLKHHWDALSAGFHENPELQEHWNRRGPEKMTAQLLEVAPTGLRDLELARWLVERERHWIEQSGGLRKVINAVFPEPVLNEGAKLALESERRQAAATLEKLAATWDSLAAQISDAEAHLRDKRVVAAAQKRWTYLFASGAARKEVELANAAIVRLTQILSESRPQYYVVSEELRQLKRRLFLA